VSLAARSFGRVIVTNKMWGRRWHIVSGGSSFLRCHNSYYEDEPGRRSTAKMLSRDEARRIREFPKRLDV